uniref:Uncharacterized protein n=1 Tax=Mycena chlorophos TaxID=658473 RepID=A0ABQ0L7N5_MYCCL|nr:predicted protein [Mycena chlorophos]
MMSALRLDSTKTPRLLVRNTTETVADFPTSPTRFSFLRHPVATSSPRQIRFPSPRLHQAPPTSFSLMPFNEVLECLGPCRLAVEDSRMRIACLPSSQDSLLVLSFSESL